MKPYFAQQAIQFAHRSKSKFRLGAVVVRGGRIIGTGVNQMGKTHPLMNRYRLNPGWSPGLHAEVCACLGISLATLEGASIYVARIRRDGSLALAEPCLICKRFLAGVGIATTYWSNNDGTWTKLAE